MSVRYMVQKTTRWSGEDVFKILDKDTRRLSLTGYINYETAKSVCSKKNQKEQELERVRNEIRLLKQRLNIKREGIKNGN